MPLENEPEAPYRFSKYRRRLSEGASLDYDDDDIERDDDDQDDVGDFSNLDMKMQGI